MEPDASDESRTVVVSGVPDLLPGVRMEEKLTVHFQNRRRSHGGDVEVVTYPTTMKGVAFVTFDRAADADRVVQKEQQILKDRALPEEYLLTVFPFSTDVFFHVSSATVDLSTFEEDQASLVQSLRSAHRSLRFQAWPRQRRATVEGPFAAVRALKEDLERRAGQIKPTPAAAAVQHEEFPTNPRVISHPEFAGPVSRSDSKAKREAAVGSDGLSGPARSTGEGSEVQSRLSNARTPNSARQKVQSFCDTGTEAEEEQIAESRLRLTRTPSAERARAKPTQRYTEDANAGARSKLSDRHRSPAQNVSTTQPPVNDVVQKHARTDKNSATGTRAQVDSYSNSLKEPHPSTSSVTARARMKAAPVFSNSGAVETADVADPDDNCMWADFYIYKYIQKLDKEYERCLRGVSARVEVTEGSDLVRICLSETQPSQGSSRVQRALENLKALVERWQTTLRVHEVGFDKKEHSKQKLMKICNEVKTTHNHHDVLYRVEDSRVKVVGPSSPSYLFSLIVQHRLKWDKLLSTPPHKTNLNT